MKILVAWSGGIDSTYTLSKLLKETDFEVETLHVHMRNTEGRHSQEDLAVNALLPKLQNIRKFWHWEVMRDDRRLPNHGYDMPIVLGECGIIMRNAIHTGKPFDTFTIGTNLEEGHWQERWDNIIGCAKGRYWYEGTDKTPFVPMPEFKFAFQWVPKSEEIKYLVSLKLYENTWSCRRPIGPNRCGTCKTCVENKKATIDIVKAVGQ